MRPLPRTVVTHRWMWYNDLMNTDEMKFYVDLEVDETELDDARAQGSNLHVRPLGEDRYMFTGDLTSVLRVAMWYTSEDVDLAVRLVHPVHPVQ